MYLFFDTETTGLPKNYNAPADDLENWPRLVQLAYLVYNPEGKLIASSNNIIQPTGFTIPIESSNIHGITTEKAMKEGRNLKEVLMEFINVLLDVKCIIAHNLSFDEKIILSEFVRGKYSFADHIFNSNYKICTMQMSTNYCAIKGNSGYKWPTLSELHFKLFGADFSGAHNALNDINATAKCFYRLLEIGIIKDIEGKIAADKIDLLEKYNLSKKGLLAYIGAVTNKSEISPKNYPKTVKFDTYEYNTVKIGNQVWLGENLKSHELNNGTRLESINGHSILSGGAEERFSQCAEKWQELYNQKKPASCPYEFNWGEGYKKFGLLYNQYCIVDKVNVERDQWRLPTEEDFQELIDYIKKNEGNNDIKNVIQKIKSSYGWPFDSKTHKNGTDKYGLKIFPGGYIGSFGFEDFDLLSEHSDEEPPKLVPNNIYAAFWLKNKSNSAPLLFYKIGDYIGGSGRMEDEPLGCSVRLIWDPTFKIDDKLNLQRKKSELDDLPF